MPDDAADSAPADAPEGAVDDLFALDPAEFVPARNALARRLRTAGNRALSTEVAKLRRPTPAAWAVNQLARFHPRELAGLMALGEALRTAQSRALGGGDAAELREAGRTRREAVGALTGLALGLLAERGAGAEAHDAAIRSTLEAASLDPGAAAAVTGGRLTTDLAPPSGFGADGDVDAASAAVPPRPTSGPEDAAAAEHTAAAAAVEEDLAEASRRSSDAASAADHAAVRAARARRAADDAEAAVVALEARLDELRRRLAAAAADADSAEGAADDAETRAADAARLLRKAEHSLEEVKGAPSAWP